MISTANMGARALNVMDRLMADKNMSDHSQLKAFLQGEGWRGAERVLLYQAGCGDKSARQIMEWAFAEDFLGVTPHRLRQARYKLNLSVYEMADRLKVNPRSLRRWEWGDAKCPLGVAAEILSMEGGI